MTLSIRFTNKTINIVDEAGKVVVRVSRTSNTSADHSRAQMIVAASEIIDAGRLLIRDGVTGADGVFTYWPAPRAGQNAIARIKTALPKERGL